ncbi:MAG: radical SAM protein [bacterium]|nr:radical SAM protein [bacterium]
MTSIFLNLPHSKKIIRRFISSYYAPNFLLPPHELLSLATIVKKLKKNNNVLFIDAIAEGNNLDEVLGKITIFQPKILVTLLGHFSIGEDLKTINEIKKAFPEIKIIATGFFPTIFPEEILKNSSIDIIIRGEPELIFSELYDQMENNGSLKTINGISFKNGENIISTPAANRIENPDDLPFPDLSLLESNLKRYKEPYLNRPFTTMTISRGCPCHCSFCIHTYGNRVFSRSLKNIEEEIKFNLTNFGIKNIRFMDDTFTLNKERTLQICGLLHKYKINWTCLSRVDTLDIELARIMKFSGCKRVYLGIESGSQKMLDLLNKNINIAGLKERIKDIKKSGLEISSFFITGIPGETDDDLSKSIELAKETDLDYIIVKTLEIWPGTELYKKYKDEIKFDLFPFENRFKDPLLEQKAIEREKRFYREFYLRPKYIVKQIKNLFIHPVEMISGFLGLCRFVFKKSNLLEDNKKDFI